MCVYMHVTYMFNFQELFLFIFSKQFLSRILLCKQCSVLIFFIQVFFFAVFIYRLTLKKKSLSCCCIHCSYLPSLRKCLLILVSLFFLKEDFLTCLVTLCHASILKNKTDSLNRITAVCVQHGGVGLVVGLWGQDLDILWQDTYEQADMSFPTPTHLISHFCRESFNHSPGMWKWMAINLAGTALRTNKPCKGAEHLTLWFVGFHI